MEIGLIAAQQVCTEHRIEIRDLRPITGSFGKKIFMINQEFLIRLSTTSMAEEQNKFRRVAMLKYAPKILQTGTLQQEDEPIYYTLLTLLPGDDFVNVYPTTTQAQQYQLGVDIAEFLDALQKISAPHYDIGLYVPALPRFLGSWREGHQQYWERLKQEAERLPLMPGSIQVFENAFRFLQESSAALDFQAGPKLLHNDFHPRNILLYQGKFSGVIDWECSQFGEADFELCHLIHWCLYPPKPDIDFRPLLRGLFEASPKCAQVPYLSQRLTIYQMEHEMQQIIWNASQAEAWRVPRLACWVNGRVDDLIRELAIKK